MDALTALVSLLCLLLPSPLLALVRRLRATPLPAGFDEVAAGRRAYEAHAGAITTAAFEDLAPSARQHWCNVARAAHGLPAEPKGPPPGVFASLLALCVLAAHLAACGTVHRTPRHDLADRIEGNAADLERFGAWDREKQLKIRGRCEAQSVGKAECDKRLGGYRETRDALRALLKQQVLTIEAAAKMLSDAEGRL